MIRVCSALFIACLLYGCSSRPIRMVTPCQGKSRTQIVKDVAAMIAAEGMNLTLVNEDAGIVQASAPESSGLTMGMGITNHWQVVVKGDTVTAIAKTVTQNGATTYFDDKVHSDWLWYWNVRNALETYCGATIRFIQQ